MSDRNEQKEVDMDNLIDESTIKALEEVLAGKDPSIFPLLDRFVQVRSKQSIKRAVDSIWVDAWLRTATFATAVTVILGAGLYLAQDAAKTYIKTEALNYANDQIQTRISALNPGDKVEALQHILDAEKSSLIKQHEDVHGLLKESLVAADDTSDTLQRVLKVEENAIGRLAAIESLRGRAAGEFDEMQKQVNAIADSLKGEVSPEKVAKEFARLLADDSSIVNGLLPIGSIMPFGGTNLTIGSRGELRMRKDDPEKRWIACNGATVDRVAFPDLASALGIEADQVTFKLPDLEGVFLRGADPEGIRDPDGRTRVVGSIQTADVGPHKHHVKLTGGEHEHELTHAMAGQGGDTDSDPNGAQNRTSKIGGGSHSHEGWTDDSPGKDTRPVNVSVNFLIKAR